MQKIRPFDIKNFTGYCVVSSTYFASYLNNLELRLVTSDIVEGKENTIAIHGLYYDGYDTESFVHLQQRLSELFTVTASC